MALASIGFGGSFVREMAMAIRKQHSIISATTRMDHANPIFGTRCVNRMGRKELLMLLPPATRPMASARRCLKCWPTTASAGCVLNATAMPNRIPWDTCQSSGSGSANGGTRTWDTNGCHKAPG